jgi:hypothetical protein
MWHVGETGEVRTDFFGKTLGNGSLERPRHRWEDDIKMDFKEIEWEVWTGLI